jgi:hypothetical protein
MPDNQSHTQQVKKSGVHSPILYLGGKNFPMGMKEREVDHLIPLWLRKWVVSGELGLGSEGKKGKGTKGIQRCQRVCHAHAFHTQYNPASTQSPASSLIWSQVSSGYEPKLRAIFLV